MLNMNFEERVVILNDSQEWQSSPAAGVDRKRLAREDSESGHATSVVRYAAGASFPKHPHPKGEEILVLDGVFSDHTGDYGPGSYLRNPPGFEHAPFSDSGCTIFVKLHQFIEGDKETVRITMSEEHWLPGQGNLQVLPLHSFDVEHTALVYWPAGERFQPHRHFGGEEIFVLKGCFKDEHGHYPSGSWIRSPHMSQHDPYVDEDTLIWVKTGHLHAG